MQKTLIVLMGLSLIQPSLAQPASDKAELASPALIDQAIAVATVGMPKTSAAAKADLRACFAAEFAIVTAADLSALIASDFGPDAALNARLNKRYPGLKQRLVTCADVVMPR